MNASNVLPVRLEQMEMWKRARPQLPEPKRNLGRLFPSILTDALLSTARMEVTRRLMEVSGPAEQVAPQSIIPKFPGLTLDRSRAPS